DSLLPRTREAARVARPRRRQRGPMSVVHDESHEALLAEVFAGDRPASTIPDCETCRREVASMEGSSRQLADAAGEYQSVRQEAAAMPESRRVASPMRRRIGWGLALLAAAAAIVLALSTPLGGGGAALGPP